MNVKGGNVNEVGTGKGGNMDGGRRKTAWMAHVKATMRAHKGMKLKQVLKLAKKTYKKKSMRGGDPYDITPSPLSGAGRRRRSGRKTRRGGNKDLY